MGIGWLEREQMIKHDLGRDLSIQKRWGRYVALWVYKIILVAADI
jgi:hypothetical protein